MVQISYKKKSIKISKNLKKIKKVDEMMLIDKYVSNFHKNWFLDIFINQKWFKIMEYAVE